MSDYKPMQVDFERRVEEIKNKSGETVKKTTATKIKFDTEDLFVFGGVVIAIIFVFGIVIGQIPVNKYSGSILGLSALAIGAARIIKARKSKEEKHIMKSLGLKDIIVMKDGTLINSQVLNKDFKIETSFGNLTIKTKDIVHIVMQKNLLHELTTRSGDSFKGQIKDPTCSVLLSTGQKADIAMTEILSIQFLDNLYAFLTMQVDVPPQPPHE